MTIMTLSPTVKAAYALCIFFHGISKAEAASPVMGLMADLMGVTFLHFGETFVQGKGNERFNR